MGSANPKSPLRSRHAQRQKIPYRTVEEDLPRSDSNSPAHHTRTLCISDLPTLTAAGTEVGGWIRTFCNVVHLVFSYVGPATLVPFYGLSPTVRSLHLIYSSAQVFDLICSFPILEDLVLICNPSTSDADAWNAPLTSPKLTGSLDLRMIGLPPPVARRLLELPGGLHFSRINLAFFDNETESMKDLVLACSDTLESLTTRRYCPSCAFPSGPVTDQYLIIICSRRRVQGRSP